MPDIAVQLLLMVLEAAMAGSILLVLFRLRGWLGLGPIYAAVGVFYYLATLLAGTTFVRISPTLLMSPGSVALFPASLFTVLFLYIRQDAEEARSMIYGLLATNIVAGLLGFVVSQHFASPLSFNPLGIQPQLFTQQPRLFIAGTVALFIDTLLIILLYEVIARVVESLFLRIYLSLALVLVFDTLLFVTAGFFENPNYADILLSGVVGKVCIAAVYSAALAVYLARFDLPSARIAPERRIRDIFDALTYRQKYEALQNQATLDTLTGLRNRGFFDDAFAWQLAAARRTGAPLALMVIDVDRFKEINDRHGHAEGDRALKTIAGALAITARSTDVVCRYGGEEFCVLLPRTNLDAASRLAERIRFEVPEACRSAGIGGGERRITVTIGIAVHPEDGGEQDALMGAADRRMYAGKAMGRDRTVAA